MRLGIFRLVCPDCHGIGRVGDERAYTIWGQAGPRHVPGDVPCQTCQEVGLRPDLLALVDRLPGAATMLGDYGELAPTTADRRERLAMADTIDALAALLGGKDQS